ncbi:MAG TPA: transposase [Gemmatimonadaceae bacterium]|nr:transposase [Gemmatimonadaceae bacterium]
MAISLQQNPVDLQARDSATELRLLYPLFEEAQRARIAHGERIRALLQGRSLGSEADTERDIEHTLKEIAQGRSGGVPEILERAYARAVDDENYLGSELRATVEDHPAWSWLKSTKGVGHLLAARLLSRLDVTRAETPSSFWAYCGLATIPGTAYRCAKCGLETAYPVGYQSRGTHFSRRGSRECAGVLEAVRSTEPVRVAPRRGVLGGRGSYDAHARKSCYLLGVSFLRCGSEYRSFYDSERERLATTRPGWTPKRSHLAALRKMQKMFLRDLWLAWRRVENLAIVPPYYPRA